MRGTDASGFAWVNPNGDGFYKRDLAGGKLPVNRIPQDASALILHTRNGTHGSASDNENNHPIISPSGDIRLVHNGVIYNHHELRQLLGNTGKKLPDVDSSVIPAMIEAFGIDSTDQISGYAACAWFDYETDNTIHLARFTQAPVVYAHLYDGSLAFASTAQILGRALNKAGVAWYGMYPDSFASMGEGDYFQILDGNIINESEVEWNHRYQYSGYDWHATTSSATKSRPTGFGAASVSSSLATAGAVTDAELAEDVEDHGQPMALTPSEETTRAIVSAVLGSEDDLADEEYDRWVRTGSTLADDDEDDEAWGDACSTVPLYYTKTHEGDYASYTSLASLQSALVWWAGVSPSENFLVGPDEGNLRWVNHFSDVGILTEDGANEESWVTNSDSYENISRLMPSWMREGMGKLRLLIGA